MAASDNFFSSGTEEIGEALSLEERQQALLELLRKVADILHDNELVFFAYYGTLLGCVRHSGFIPWDDDVDLAMYRSDYEKLKLIDWSKYGLLLHSPQMSENSPYTFSKLSDNSFVFFEEVQNGDAATGLSIDVFPMDSASTLRLAVSPLLVRMLCRILTLKIVTDRPGRKLYKSALLRLGRVILKPVPVGVLTRSIDQLSKRHGRNNAAIGCLSGTYRAKEVMPKSWFYDLKALNFENLKIAVPNGYESILSHLYGDYMELPPENRRVTHHANAVYRRL